MLNLTFFIRMLTYFVRYMRKFGYLCTDYSNHQLLSACNTIVDLPCQPQSLWQERFQSMPNSLPSPAHRVGDVLHRVPEPLRAPLYIM